MTPDSCRVAERNMGLSPRLLLSGSRSGGVESLFCSIPLAPRSLLPCLFFKNKGTEIFDTALTKAIIIFYRLQA
jgi:hypothetical protein